MLRSCVIVHGFSGVTMKMFELNQDLLASIKVILDTASFNDQRYYRSIEGMVSRMTLNAQPSDNKTLDLESRDRLYATFAKELEKLVQQGDYPGNLQVKSLEAFRKVASLESTSKSPSPVLHDANIKRPKSTAHFNPPPPEDIDSDNVQEQVDCLEKQGLYKDVPFQCQNDLKSIAIFHIESGGESRSLTKDIFDLLSKKGKMTEKRANELAVEKDNLIWNEVRVVCPKKHP